MKFLSRTAVRNCVFVGGALLLSTAYISYDGFSNSGGIPSPAGKDGCTCHGDGESSDATTVEITTAATVFEPGQTYDFVVTVKNANNPEAGFSLSNSRVKDSVFTTTDAGARAPNNRSYVTHRAPRALTDGEASWTFKYRAPRTPGVTDVIYAAGNAVDNNGNASAGDQWNRATYTVTTASGSVDRKEDIAGSFTVGPNPSKNFSKLFFDLKKHASLRVSLVDVAGREVYLNHVENAAPGRGETLLDMTDLPAGDYFVHVTSGGSLLYTGKISRVK